MDVIVNISHAIASADYARIIAIIYCSQFAGVARCSAAGGAAAYTPDWSRQRLLPAERRCRLGF
eukprot:838478-Amphidinium_carterae.1